MTKQLTLTDYPLLKPYHDTYTPAGSDLSLTNLLMWQDKYKTHFTCVEGYVYYIYDTQVSNLVCSPPVGDYTNQVALKLSLAQFVNEAKVNHHHVTFTRCTSDFIDLLTSLYANAQVENVRDHWDYCYESQALADLVGNSHHKKKNHVNQFLKAYGDTYKVEPLTPQNIEACLACAKAWCLEKGCEDSADLSQEFLGIEKALDHWNDLPLQGVVIKVNDTVVAFSFGEALTQDTFVIHIEKADQAYKGIYAFLNQAFAKVLAPTYTYINREQDLGIAGIRKAKLSYHPHHFIEKSTLTL